MSICGKNCESFPEFRELYLLSKKRKSLVYYFEKAEFRLKNREILLKTAVKKTSVKNKSYIQAVANFEKCQGRLENCNDKIAVLKDKIKEIISPLFGLQYTIFEKRYIELKEFSKIAEETYFSVRNIYYHAKKAHIFLEEFYKKKENNKEKIYAS